MGLFPSESSPHSHYSHSRTVDEMNVGRLPPRASTSEDRVQCDDTLKPLLDMSASVYVKNLSWSDERNSGYVGEFHSSFWQFYEDRRGKPGWIDEIPLEGGGGGDGESKGAVAEGGDLSTKPPNLDKSKTERTLTFSFTDPSFQMSKGLTILKIFFMKTYKNAGEVKLTLCGTPIVVEGAGDQGQIDALHKDYHNWHFSVNEGVTVFYNPFFADFCGSLTKAKNNDTTTPYVITLTHQYIDYPPIDFRDQTEYLLARGRQKFKLDAIKMCTPASK